MPKQKPKKVVCDCGKRFLDPQSRSRHIRDSPVHQQPVSVASNTDATSALADESAETQEPPAGKGIEPEGSPCTIKSITGKGKGLVATTKILKGTRILSEAPLFQVPRDSFDIKAVERIVLKEVESLDADQQHTFFDLSNIYRNAHSQPFGIARTNVLPLGPKARSGGLFLKASRINHSCRHNSQNTWNEITGRLNIHALRDIEEGEEITINYLASTTQYVDRQTFLQEKFKFDCKCELCSLPRRQRKRSDARLREIQVIDNLIGRFFWDELEVETALRYLHRMLDLFEEEGIWDGSVARAYKDAYDVSIAGGDEQRARIFAERTYDIRRLIEGDDSPVTTRMKEKAEGLSTDAPEGLGEADFENWLWMLPV